MAGAGRPVQGPSKEVYFAQVHEPGQMCQSDFTHMSSLGVTIQRQPFEHMVYHFVLTYSNLRELEPIESEGLYYH